MPDLSEPTPDPPSADRTLPPRSELPGGTGGAAPLPPEFDDYDSLEELGRGGMGVVYKARQKKLSRWVAIKCMSPAFAHPQAREWFFRECRNAAATQSDHVVVIHTTGEHGGIPYLVMEFLHGLSLDKWLKTTGRIVTPADAVRVANDTLWGLDAAHKANLIHRDIKPSNLFVMDGTGHVKILDFGLTRCLGGHAATTTGEGVGVGTAEYMAPEQVLKELDQASDLFSLGVVLYEMLSGRSPFKRENDPAKIGAVLFYDPPPLMTAPPPLAEFVTRLMAKERSGRPASATAALAELRKVEEQMKALPRPVVPVPLPPSLVVEVQRSSRPRSGVRTPGEEVDFPLPGGLKMTFCWIPPGTAQLGSPKTEQDAVAAQLGSRPGWLAAESEAKRGVFTSKGFWLGKYPVTQAEWYSLTGECPSCFQAGSDGKNKVKGVDTSRFPVEQVSWDMLCGPDGEGGGDTFLGKLNALANAATVFGTAGKFVLPHEDEWEFACRGGEGNNRPFYWGAELNGTQANMDGSYPFGTAKEGSYLERPTPVGSYAAKSPHPWGLCDMIGNVWEWCENLYDQTSYHVRRGGSWYTSGHNCRAANRERDALGNFCGEFGFRVCFRRDS